MTAPVRVGDRLVVVHEAPWSIYAEGAREGDAPTSTGWHRVTRLVEVVEVDEWNARWRGVEILEEEGRPPGMAAPEPVPSGLGGFALRFVERGFAEGRLRWPTG